MKRFIILSALLTFKIRDIERGYYISAPHAEAPHDTHYIKFKKLHHRFYYYKVESL